ncbi:hypothetical protein HMPREF1640_06930, partial [Prevotella sp. S7-1-8]|jgi:hypothetical protein|uniref:hypothetical protein n=1 Tax=Prevotella sp. S7-1-8 TaxID=1284775 RepID=UPI00050F307E
MKRLYEKPVVEVLRMEDSMQIICSSGGTNQTNFKIDKWGKAEETDAEGTSEAIDKFPDWLNDNP